MSYYIGAILGSIVMGLIIGAIPAVLANKKGENNLAIISMGACVLGSFIAGLYFSVPLCIVFTVIILVKGKK